MTPHETLSPERVAGTVCGALTDPAEIVAYLRAGKLVAMRPAADALEALSANRAALIEERDRLNATIARCSGYQWSVEHHQARADRAEALLSEAMEGLGNAVSRQVATYNACPLTLAKKLHAECPSCGATPRQNCGKQITADTQFRADVDEVLARITPDRSAKP